MNIEIPVGDLITELERLDPRLLALAVANVRVRALERELEKVDVPARTSEHAPQEVNDV